MSTAPDPADHLLPGRFQDQALLGIGSHGAGERKHHARMGLSKSDYVAAAKKHLNSAERAVAISGTDGATRYVVGDPKTGRVAILNSSKPNRSTFFPNRDVERYMAAKQTEAQTSWQLDLAKLRKGAPKLKKPNNSAPTKATAGRQAPGSAPKPKPSPPKGRTAPYRSTPRPPERSPSPGGRPRQQGQETPKPPGPRPTPPASNVSPKAPRPTQPKPPAAQPRRPPGKGPTGRPPAQGGPRR